MDTSCCFCKHYADCAYRLLIDGELPCAGEGFEPFA